jgi:thiol:disulfide interchange protein
VVNGLGWVLEPRTMEDPAGEWARRFNQGEAFFWLAVAGWIVWRVRPADPRQRRAAVALAIWFQYGRG